MGKSCVYAPKKGVKTFQSLQKEFGYDLAWKIYGIAMNPKFKEDYKESLSLDAEGVPSFDSLMDNDFIIKVLGNKIGAHLRKNFPNREDSIDNYYLMLEDAKKFNQDSKYNKYTTAVVGYDNDGNLTLNFLRKSESSDKKFSRQYSTAVLNRRLAAILSPLGVTIGLLSDIEKDYGRVGVTDFSIAKNIATDSISMIRIANNMEGVNALSEEFAHLIIGAMRNNPLIQRNINALANESNLRSILGDDYQDVFDFYDGNLELMAEEALGHILQQELIRQNDTSGIQGRLIRNIQGKFKNISENEISEALIEAESNMSNLASNILSGTLNLTKKDIRNSQRDAQFNALSDRIKRNMDLLKEARDIESKRLKVATFSEDAQDYISNVLRGIETNMNNKDTTLGVLSYSNEALISLKAANKSLSELASANTKDKFKILRGIRGTLQAYGKYIESLNDIALEEAKEEDNDFLRDIPIQTKYGTEVLSVKEVLRDLNDIYKQVARQYLKVAIPSFAEFLRPILGDEVTLEFGNNAGKKVNLEQLIQQSESDISFMDRWLDSMGNSSDILLRAFDKVYKQAMDKSRLKSIKDFRRIQALMQEANSKGITTFDWMFERYNNGGLTGNYISEVNESQYIEDLLKHRGYLNKKYGKNPKGDNLKAKMKEEETWYKAHSKLTIFGERVANDSYKNPAYARLTLVQKDILDKFLKLKEEFDNQYPSNRTETNKAIQLRKDGVQRFIDSYKTPSSIWSNIKEHLKEEFLDRGDDLASGLGGRRTLTDFAGKEFMTLPVLFTTRLENPNELSTDVFGSLMAYAAASNNYRELDKIVDPLEVGRALVIENRTVKSTRGGLNVFERFTAAGRDVQNEVIERRGSNIEKRLDDFFESQIYHRYLKDEGVFNILGTKVNKAKLANAVMSGSSLAQLGFNWLANLANVVTGTCMQNIEAASRQYFNAKELAKADTIYAANIGQNVAEFNSRVKTNKLSLFNELFNVRSDFDNITHNSMRKGVLSRLFSSEIAFLGQGAGDHWLYMRTAIAMSLREKVKVPGKGEMSLWDALEIKDSFEGNNKIKEMVLPEGTTDINGNPFNIGAFSRKIAKVNQNLFGIYNTDDRNAAHRVILGRMLTQYRNWMKPQYNRRFQVRQFNLDLNDWEEGYYRTTGRIMLGLFRGQYQLGALWKELTLEEKANVRRAITEMLQLTAVWALVSLVKWDDDKDRPWALKLAEYSATRLEHELGTLAPSPLMIQELLKTVKSPAASISQLQNLTNLMMSIMDPRDWTDEIESGKYEGLSTLEKNFLKSGLPPFAQYQQINKAIYNIDDMTNWFARSY